jgi:sec-independent protein translocase protein TatA
MFRNPTADLLVVLLIVLLILGPKRLPSLGRSLGQGLREFKDSIGGGDDDDDDDERPAITQASETAAAPAPAPAAAAAQPAPEPARAPADVASKQSS